ncbi:COX15-CtaA-domain-containing protein [Pseudovirgaria hyperparasitica]|uniref:COX15-CtaA-domain-containing protein n=1 Tax=Pseudovirgaria hyperparasitica TaxID=470096 RepID=A0A6A6WCM1_9PEZI|nr:COX15-CtaA-domain-containing protein [Pseudovirgaria hyperparasitica]KAF2760453.1 COX15-CtaA-domain-containing protein [Pseudovirgaria hyperparasitica]
MASTFTTFPHLRSATPRSFNECSRCLARVNAAFNPVLGRINQRSTAHLAKSLSGRRPQLITVNALQGKSRVIPTPNRIVRNVSTQAHKAKPNFRDDGQSRSKKHFPTVSDKIVAYWLLGSAASVFGIVVFGGLTRLTESGLSITEWRPVAGSLPPMSAEAWGSEFSKYRDSPEFQLLNPRMTLDEFKQIYWMEWGHRLWGRVIGVTFIVPTAYFIARGMVSARMAVRLVGISGLIGFQGFLGWWMVKSGLKDDLFASGSHPRVSQYRLTAHLGTAFLVYASMVASGLDILRERRWFYMLLIERSKRLAVLGKHSVRPRLRLFQNLSVALIGLIFTTAMSGGLVAGLDAGLIYNEFPHMGQGFTPPKKELFDPFYSHRPDNSDLWWRNMLENPSLVQLEHRMLATTTFTAVMALFAFSRFANNRHVIPKGCHRAILGMAYLVTLQATLGISTLIYLVPTWLASLHQAGSLALLTGAIVLSSRTRLPAHTIKNLREAHNIQTLLRPNRDLRSTLMKNRFFNKDYVP